MQPRTRWMVLRRPSKALLGCILRSAPCAVVLCPDPVHEELLVHRPVRQFAAAFLPRILATTAQPDGLVPEVFLLLVGQVASPQVVLEPFCVVEFVVHFEISQAQARLRPPEVVLGAVDALEHEGFAEGVQELATVVHVAPVLRRFDVVRARVARSLSVAEAEVTDGFQLPEVPDPAPG